MIDEFVEFFGGIGGLLLNHVLGAPAFFLAPGVSLTEELIVVVVQSGCSGY